MKILHYSLGFSPYRSGGMTRYVEDLMSVQIKEHEVGLLWPGRMRIGNKKIAFKKKKHASGVTSYELINPLPVPLMEGVKDIAAYTRKGDLQCFLEFLKKEQPDVIHIHTFMGLYAEFLEAAKHLNIKTVFTTHDYYAICPKVNLLCNGRVCTTGMGDKCCSGCDMNPLSMNKVFILQSPLYRYFKESALIKSLRKNWARNKQNTQSQSLKEKETLATKEVISYGRLKEYYQKMLQMISIVHCNSTLAKETYEEFVSLKQAVVVSISNRNVVDERIKKTYQSNRPIKITYLGPASEYKGYFMLVEALEELNQKYENAFELSVYTAILEEKPYIKAYDSFGEGGLGAVLNKTDILAAPSIWKETFGFVALEALSRGVPVIVTENVGSKDLIVDGKNGLIIAPQKKALVEALERVWKEPQLLTHMNESILQMDFPYTMQAHAKELQQKIYS